MAPVSDAEYQIEPLGSHHDRANFTCGVPALDAYLRQQARQDQDRRLAAVFILTPDSKSVAGFYTLSSASILAEDVPHDLRRKLPRFPLPVTLVGRMAVSENLRGRGLGNFLLMHALERALLSSTQVASWGVIVDAKAGAREFYLKQGFVPFPATPERLLLPMATIAKSFA